MCARYQTIETLDAPFADYRISWAGPRLSETRREMFPRYLGPVVRLREGEPGLDAMTWGLIPFWAKEPDFRKFRHNFNARGETVDTVASFRAPFRKRRCLVPALSFVEHPLVEGRKVAHRVAGADGRPLMFAGLWDHWPARSGADEVYSFTIITIEPHPELRWLRHRVPVTLSPEACATWMDPSTPVSEAKSLLVSPEPELLAATPLASG